MTTGRRKIRRRETALLILYRKGEKK